MKSLNLKIIMAMLACLFIAACGKTVTNNVAGPNSSTPSPGGTSAPQAQDSGGVINGGGGRGVRCTKNGNTTVEVLDLYEARTLYNLQTMDFGSSEDAAKDKLAGVLAKHFWNPFSSSLPQFTQYMRGSMVDEFLKNIRFTEAGKTLRLANDAYAPTLETGCEPVQIAFYYDESVLLVDKALWDQLNLTNKMALIAHEALYFLARQSGTTNSMSTRKLVGMLFSPQGIRSLADGVPTDQKKFLNCRMEARGFSNGHFFLYSSKDQNQSSGLEAVFTDLGGDGSLFRTSSFFGDLSFVHLESPRFSGTREAALIKDTYPARDRVSLAFRGIVDGQLKAVLNTFKGSSASSTQTYDVSCPLPADFSSLQAQITEPGKFEQKLGDGSTDVLTIAGNGSLTLELTRQVGGTGGISNYGVVPYETNCRVKQTGIITSQTESEIQYQVISGELGDLTGLRNTQHCGAYIESFNRGAADGSMRFTIRKSEFQRVGQ